MKPTYYTVEQMIEMIDEPNRTSCLRILSDNKRLFQKVQGSKNNHQAWPGGYFDHVQEVMNLAVALHGWLNSLRLLPFSLSDLLLVMYIHDIEKPWKYFLGEDGQIHYIPAMKTKRENQRFRMAMLKKYSISLTLDHENAIKYAEGESRDYSNSHRVMGPLAAVAHMCDVASARVWFDHPMEHLDPWIGSKRIR